MKEETFDKTVHCSRNRSDNTRVFSRSRMVDNSNIVFTVLRTVCFLFEFSTKTMTIEDLGAQGVHYTTVCNTV